MALDNASMVVGNHTGVLGLRWFDLAWVSHVCVCLCVQRSEVASVYAFHGWNAMAGKQSRGWKEGHGGGSPRFVKVEGRDLRCSAS